MAPNFDQLFNDVGEIKGTLKQLIPKVERAMNNQEEAFKRLNQIEIKAGEQNKDIENNAEKIEEIKIFSKRISSMLSIAITVSLNVLKMVFWKDQ